MTILQKMMFWLALKLLVLSTEEVEADTYLLNVPSTKTKTLRLKSTQMTGLLNATRGARVADSILQKRFPSYDPKRDKYMLPNRSGKPIVIHKIK